MVVSEFALFGAEPAFKMPMPIGQLYFPSWDRYESAVRGIFDRQYYNNNGPLLTQLEDKLQQFLGIKHAICVSNATIGLMMVADALRLSGKVILPAFTFIASPQSVSWAGLEPVFCDIDAETHHVDINQVEALIDEDVSAIMGVNLWGGACQVKALVELAETRCLHLYFDSAHAFGSAVDGVRIGNFGDAEVFSFHATKILSATEGGCICTSDDALAARLRSIRPSYGTEATVSVARVANARMSEAQAAIALMSLEDFPHNQKHNAELFSIYMAQLARISGLRPHKPTGVSFSNYQSFVCEVDEGEFGLSRDILIELFKAENVIARRYFYPGAHRSVPYMNEFPQFTEAMPNTDQVNERIFQLPIGALVTDADVVKICDIARGAQQRSAEIRERLRR